MGGTKDPAANDVPNLALLCGTGTTGCHGHIESHRTQAKADGWIVPKWENPQTVPMSDVFGNRFLFDGTERVDLQQLDAPARSDTNHSRTDANQPTKEG